MKIEASGIQMSSSHVAHQHREVQERLRRWIGERPDFEAGLEASAQVSLSAPARAMQGAADKDIGAPDESNATSEALEAANNDPQLLFLRTLLEKTFGIKLRYFNPAMMKPDPQLDDEALQTVTRPAPANRFGIEYDYQETYTETETTQFSAEGFVRTADGQEVRFNISLEMTRSYSEQINFSLRAGDAAQKKDPLVMNFNGNSAQLSDQRFEIDLDGDGQKESAHFVAHGSGFLVFDRNADGKINDGTELFGPTTGDGFAELAAHDEDNNGWIDENDAIFARLQLWTKAPDNHDSLQSLEEAGVGAISLDRLTTPFALKGAQNKLLGEVRNSGVYLTEDGRAGTVQQIDLAV